jgi:hypothetical protein
MRNATEAQRNAGQPHHHPPAPIIGGIKSTFTPNELTYLSEQRIGRLATADRNGRRASGGGTPGGGPAILGRRGGRPGHRHGTRRSGSDHRVPVSRAQDDPDPRDPRTSDRRGRHDPHRRDDGGRDAAARRGQPGKAASVHVNHTGSSSQGKCPAPGCTANSACSKRPAHSAAFGP